MSEQVEGVDYAVEMSVKPDGDGVCDYCNDWGDLVHIPHMVGYDAIDLCADCLKNALALLEPSPLGPDDEKRL